MASYWYMPYWDCSVQTVDNYAELVGKLDALIATHRTSAPVAYSRPALKLRRRPKNAPKRSGSGALRRRAV